MILRSGLERLTQAGKISPGSVADSASSIAAVAVRHDAPKQRRIAELALKSRLPTIYELRQFRARWRLHVVRDKSCGDVQTGRRLRR
jgi:hypothetical protein